MKIINPSVEYIPQSDNTLKGIYEQIEKAGRTCYKSEDKITEGSAEAFVKRMIESNHTAMLEHGTVYLTLTINKKDASEIVTHPRPYDKNNPYVKYREVFGYIQAIFKENPYSKVVLHYDHDEDETTMCITTNYRVIIENKLEDIMQQYISEPTRYHYKRITLKFTTNIGVTREGNRHRVNSIAEESTRYCNYTKEKFGKELNVCSPAWFHKEKIEDYENENGHLDFYEYMENILINKPDNGLSDIDYYLFAMYACEFSYNNLINLGWTPQQAREVLPLATKSEVVYTAFPHQWKHWFDLRWRGTTGKPHPNMKEISDKAVQVLKENDLWDNIYLPNDAY